MFIVAVTFKIRTCAANVNQSSLDASGMIFREFSQREAFWWNEKLLIEFLGGVVEVDFYVFQEVAKKTHFWGVVLSNGGCFDKIMMRGQSQQLYKVSGFEK